MRRRARKNKNNAFSTIIFDKSISDPANISGDINQGVIAKILSKFRRCLVKKTGDGEVSIAWLDDTNSNYYEDGTPAILTGNEGDVMVYMPGYYYKYERIDTNRFAYHFSLRDIGTGWIRVSESLLGTYGAYYQNSAIYSRSKVSSSSSISMNNFKQYAANRGKGYQIIDYQQHCSIAMMFYAKYGTRDAQAILGNGIHYHNTVHGSTDGFGIQDTQNVSTHHVNFLGIEAVYGGKYEGTSGVVVNNYLWTITDADSGATRRVQAIAGSPEGVWIQDIAASNGPYFDMVPISIGGDGRSYYSDQYYTNTQPNLVLYRGGDGMTLRNGLAATNVDHDSVMTSIYVGSRLAFRGNICIASDTTSFKALPLI